MRGIGKVKPDATGSGAKVRQPESPQEAHLLYTRRSAEVRHCASPDGTSRMGPEKQGVGAPRWLVTCSCGWGRECSSEWAAQSVTKLHPQLAPIDVARVTRVEGPEDVQASGSSA